MNSQLLRKTYTLGARRFHVAVVINTNKPSAIVDSIIRVDHAGELGADRIYAGQMAILGNTKVGPLIQHMWDQEKVHKETFEKLIVKHRVRPTALVPLWNVAGFLLGAGTALMGEKAAMACTVAVESVIVEHYNDQLRILMAEPEKHQELMQTIQKFRDDEQEHHDTGIDQGAEQAPFYKALSEVIKFGCKTAIAMSKGLFSQRNEINLVNCRTYCTSEQSKERWDLFSAVCVERKPVILKPFNELEKKVLKTFQDLEVEKSYKSDHEIKLENDLKRKEMIKTGQNVDLEVVLQQSAIEFEDMSNKELKMFKSAPLVTPEDEKNYKQSLNRKLSDSLYLLIQKKIGNNDHWIFPQGIRKESENLKETAQRVVAETCGDNLQVMFLGNAPCGFYKYTYPKPIRTESRGAKIFFFKAHYISGNLDSAKMLEYQWATRKDLGNLMFKKYYNKVSLFLIEEDEDNDGYEKLKEKVVGVNG